MARHEIVIHENTGALAENAPYLGSYIAKETLQMAAFANAVGAKCGLPGIQVMAILGGAFEAIEALERTSLVRVWTDLGVVCAVITGSLPTADAAFDPERNSLELVLRLGDDIRYGLTDTVPTIITDEDLTKLRVDNAMDLEMQKPMNLIHGQHVFRVAGFNMVLSDEGAAAYLENGVGTTFPLVVDEVVSKQLFKAHTAELLPADDYKLVVKSRAGDAAGPLQTSFRRVKYLRVEDPAPDPTPVVNSVSADAEGAEPGYIVRNENIAILGRNFGNDSSAVSVKFTNGEEPLAWGRILEMDGNRIKIEWPDGLAHLAGGDEVTVTVTRTVDGESYASSPVTVTVATA